eukprot:12261354-Heterocapsa_arctica.AAC.1
MLCIASTLRQTRRTSSLPARPFNFSPLARSLLASILLVLVHADVHVVVLGHTSPHLLLRRAERTSRFAFHRNRFRAQSASHRHVRLLRCPRAGSSTGGRSRLLLRVRRVE